MNRPCRCEGKLSCTERSEAAGCHAPKLCGCHWPACYSITLHCPCRCKAPKQQAVELAALALLYSRAPCWLRRRCVHERRRYSAFAPVCWPACLSLASCCPCRFKSPKQQAAEQSEVAGCGGDEAMRLSVQKRRRYPAFAQTCWPACLALALCSPAAAKSRCSRQ